MFAYKSFLQYTDKQLPLVTLADIHWYDSFLFIVLGYIEIFQLPSIQCIQHLILFCFALAKDTKDSVMINTLNYQYKDSEIEYLNRE